jgi:hypothetical protein
MTGLPSFIVLHIFTHVSLGHRSYEKAGTMFAHCYIPSSETVPGTQAAPENVYCVKESSSQLGMA